MIQRRILSFLLALSFVSTIASSQLLRLNPETGQTERLQYLIGGYAALSLNFQQANFGTLPGFPSCCATYGQNTTISPAFGAAFELPITEVFRIQGRLGYSSLSGLLRSVEQIGNEPVQSDGPVPILQRQPVNVEHTLDASLPMIVIEPSIGYRLFDLLWVTAGVRGGLLLSSSFIQKETLIDPPGYTFLDGTTIRNAAQSDIPNVNTFQLHGIVGIGYELMTKNGISIVPEVRYYLPLTSISNVDWKVQSFQIGVSVRYGSYEPVEATIEGDTVYYRDTVIVEKTGLLAPRITLRDSREDVETRRLGDVEYRTVTIKESYIREIPRPFNPGLRSSIIARRADGTTGPLDVMRVEELDVIESYPLLPQVFYPEDAADLASTQQIRLEASEAVDFRATNLSRDQIDVYRNVLNVIGYRMKQTPGSKITLEGHVSNVGPELNDRDLSRARAESVKSYLTSTWGIEPERISVKSSLLPSEPANPTTPDGKGENQRVEISSSDPSILEPVEFRDKDLIIAPTDLVLRPEVSDADGVKDWSVKMSQGGRELYRSQGEGAPRDVPVDVARSDAKPRKEGPIVSTFSVRDANGLAAESSDTLNVDYVTLQTMKSRQEEGKMVERYSLIVFDFNSAQLNSSNQRIMERVKQRIQPDSKVRITGFADRQGNPDYNRELARKRCVEAQRVLGLGDDRVTLEPIGSDRLVFNNDTPEGRSYSRTVQIEIVTPVR
ncbi:MAG: OmpA family protein [Candidatus Kapabacteria bacterium]|nr:OmpA family protein [Candidatus Kapabacteria bacterium]